MVKLKINLELNGMGTINRIAYMSETLDKSCYYMETRNTLLQDFKITNFPVFNVE